MKKRPLIFTALALAAVIGMSTAETGTAGATSEADVTGAATGAGATGAGSTGAGTTGAGTTGAAAAPDVEWQRLPDGPDRALQSMIYDAANDSLWSFGGIEADVGSNNFNNTVYRLDLADAEARWGRLAIGGLRPPPLAFHSAIYDPLRNRMVVYGGLVDREGTSDQTPADGNTVWFLDLKDPETPTWSRASVPGIAIDRFAHAAVYLPDADAMIVSGGLKTFDNAGNDNYALLLGEEPMSWVRLPNAGFVKRAGHALMYDAIGERLLAYGGLPDLSNVNTYSDIISLDLSDGLDGSDRWLRVSTSTPGLSRAFMATAYDPDRHMWWVHGGIVANNRFLRDLSVLDLNADKPEWTRTQVVYNGPLERFGHPGVWDALRHRMIVQGGTPDNNNTLKDTRAMAYLAPDPATATASATSTEAVPPTSASTPTATDDPATTTATPTSTTAGDTPTVTQTAPTATEPAVTASSTPTTSTPSGSSILHLPVALSASRGW